MKYQLFFLLYDVLLVIFEVNYSKIIFFDLIYIFSGYGINVLWFLSTLFLSKMILYFFIKIDYILKSKSKKKVFIEILIYIASILLGIFSIFLTRICIEYFPENDMVICILQNILRSITANCFLLLGYYLLSAMEKIKNIKIVKILLVTLILSAIIPMILKYKVTMVLNYSNPIYCIFIFGTMASLSIISISMLLEKNIIGKILKFYGRQSLFIMINHEYMQLRSIIQNCFGFIQDYNFKITITFIVILIVEFLLIKLFNVMNKKYILDNLVKKKEEKYE